MSNFETQFERLPNMPFTPPAIERLLDSSSADKTWPEHIINNPDFHTQVEAQRHLLESLQNVVKDIPTDLNIEDALASGVVTSESITALYNQLVEYLRRDSANARIVLYFPFEIIPPPHIDTEDTELAASIHDFNNEYVNAWEAQLGFHEVRANFVDGDILEPELLSGDHPRVVKAVHLIPSLIERGIITFEQAYAHIESSGDQLLKDDFLDTCGVIADKGLLSDENLSLLTTSADSYIRNGARLLQSQKISRTEAPHETQSLGVIFDSLDKDIETLNNSESEPTTPARAAWLKKDAKEKALKGWASKVTTLLQTGLQLPEAKNLEATLVSIEALRQASLHDSLVFENHRNWLQTVWQSERSADIDDALTKLYAHLNSAQIVSDEDLKHLGIRIPKLAGPFSENLKPVESFIKEVENMTSEIEGDSYLHTRIYPVSLIFGSQLKGYGTKNADADVAVFVKPQVNRSERVALEQSLAHIFAHEKIGGKVVLFWTDEVETGVKIHDYLERATSDGESSWIHVLFGAAWTGDKDTITELHHHLLAQYFYDPKTTLQGKPARERWLEEMERDTLQYRLLHKGFERYFPIKSPMDTTHGDAIDGKSAFYDPRYRRIATELFLSKVFLPKLQQ